MVTDVLRAGGALSFATQHDGGASQPASPAAAVGGLFRDLRRHLNVPLPDLAAVAGTRIDVILALERGEVSRLPAWEETERVVTALTGIARIDPSAVLSVLRQEMGVAPTRGRAAARSPAGKRKADKGEPVWTALLAKVTAIVPADSVARAGVHLAPLVAPLARIKRGPLVAGVLVAVAGLGMWTGPGWIAASATALPAPITTVVKKAHNYVLWRMAPTRNGLKWIEVDDPRARRGDRLPTGR